MDICTSEVRSPKQQRSTLSQDKRLEAIPEKQPPDKVARVNLWLRVENNNKFVRRKTKVRREIENGVLSRYQMHKPHKSGWDYELAIAAGEYSVNLRWSLTHRLQWVEENDSLGDAYTGMQGNLNGLDRV